MKKTILLICLVCLSNWACGQTPKSIPPKPRQNTKLVGGRCEGCELYKEGMPAKLNWQTQISIGEEGESLQISGTIYKNDGKTPVADVILYIYHTDKKGLYTAAKDQTDARRHGRLRGWMRTDATGRYQFSTIRPASYPNSDILQHIHPTIKEADKNEYWLDDFVFEDDPKMNEAYRKSMQNRGGSGIIQLTKNREGVWIGKRDIVLGLNVPNYQ